MANILELNDGYNEHKLKFFAEPIERDGDLVRLRCAEPGKEYLTAWKHQDDASESWIRALEKRSMSAWSAEELATYEKLTGQAS